MNLRLLAQDLESHRPRLIYTISTLHNPTGIITCTSHRRKLLALAEQCDCLASLSTQQGYPALRLNFSLSPKQTERGVQILGGILRTV